MNPRPDLTVSSLKNSCLSNTVIVWMCSHVWFLWVMWFSEPLNYSFFTHLPFSVPLPHSTLVMHSTDSRQVMCHFCYLSVCRFIFESIYCSCIFTPVIEICQLMLSAEHGTESNSVVQTDQWQRADIATVGRMAFPLFRSTDAFAKLPRKLTNWFCATLNSFLRSRIKYL